VTLLVLPRLNGNVQYSTTFHLLKPIDQRACSSNDPTAAASPDIGGGQSQAGRFLRTFLDGATPHIAGQASPDGPTWAPIVDPLARRLAGNADACRETLSCSKIIHSASITSPPPSPPHLR